MKIDTQTGLSQQQVQQRISQGQSNCVTTKQGRTEAEII